jgi:hypothetical protein
MPREPSLWPAVSRTNGRAVAPVPKYAYGPIGPGDIMNLLAARGARFALSQQRPNPRGT